MQRQIRPLNFLRSLICSICCTAICISTFPASATEKQSHSSLSSFGLSDEEFTKEVKKYLGIPYRLGGSSKKGMDCSNFSRIVYSKILGLEIPNNSIKQFSSSDLKPIDSDDLQMGDLIFFGTKKQKINHVGVYLSDGQFIHASSSKGITVSRLDSRYWKKRFVSSKRHMALSSNQDSDEIRFESFLEIPVGQDGTVTAYSRDIFRTSLQNSSSASDISGSSEIIDQNHSPLNFYEIGYGQAISSGLELSLSGIYEKSGSGTAWSNIDFTTQNMSFRDDRSDFDTSVRQGLKLASDIRPSNWLNITPSVTFFHYPSENNALIDGPQKILGLNALLAPVHKRWSLAMLFQYSDHENRAEPETFDDMFSSLDMAVKFGINLTDNLQFSIIGSHDNRTTADDISDDSSFSQSTGNSNLFFSIDMKY
ncbi:MAG: C40 family peptidase [Desulforhopalus sp.]